MTDALRRSVTIGSILFIQFQTLSASASAIALSEYLNQVKEKHLGFQASQTSSEGAQLRASEGDLILSPVFFVNGQMNRDKKLNFFLQNNQTDQNNATAGFSKLTSFGTQAKVSYGYNYTEYSKFSDPRKKFPAFYQFQTTFELSQSIWRNFFGSETRAQRNQIEAQATASHYVEKYKTRLLLAEAESTYWRLTFSRLTVQVQTEALARAKKMYDWNTGRAKLHLADSADAFQSEALLKIKALDLQNAQDEERAASRAFNLARGFTEDLVSEDLEIVDASVLSQVSIPNRVEKREDILAAEEQERATWAAADLAKERTLPSFDVFGSYSLNGQKTDQNDAFKGSFKNEQPTQAAGLKFSAPLDFWGTSDIRSGWQKEKIAAEFNLQRKRLEQDNEWTDLQQKMGEARKRLQLCLAIEQVQNSKLTHERDRFKRGRSTTFQILQFEQDFSQAQLLRIRAQSDILQVLARMKTFQVNL